MPSGKESELRPEIKFSPCALLCFTVPALCPYGVGMETKTLKLTKAQAECASWLLGCPLFCDEDQASLEHGWDISAEEAASLLSAAKMCRLDGLAFIVPMDSRVIEYLSDYANQLADMGATEAADHYIANGDDERTARCKANAATKCASNLAAMIDSLS